MRIPFRGWFHSSYRVSKSVPTSTLCRRPRHIRVINCLSHYVSFFAGFDPFQHLADCGKTTPKASRTFPKPEVNLWFTFQGRKSPTVSQEMERTAALKLYSSHKKVKLDWIVRGDTTKHFPPCSIRGQRGKNRKNAFPFSVPCTPHLFCRVKTALELWWKILYTIKFPTEMEATSKTTLDPTEI